jgi:hypothetical protein
MAKPVLENVVPPGSAAIHALVLGVGHYVDPGLPGLDGAAPSAFAFADWLVKQQKRPGLALGSLDVLASQPSGAAVSWQGTALAHPTLANVRTAVNGWHERCDADPNQLAIFYFCGHGIALGDFQSLILGDVDPNVKTDPFANALAFDDFVVGMKSCGAREQLYVIDACRELPVGFGKWDDNVPLGAPLVRVNKKRMMTLPPGSHVVLHATSATQKAWAGKSGGWFTHALLTVLEGAAGDNRLTESEQDYAVSTRDIADVIKHLVKLGFLDAPAGPQQPVRRGDGDFDLHRPSPPVVPVLVTRRPPATNLGAQFVARSGDQQVASHACVDEEPWRPRLPLGSYVFLREGDSVAANVVVPAKRVELP